MKTFMVLGAGILQVPLIRQAKKMGFAPVVVSPDKDDPGFRYALHAVYADVRDAETILTHAKKHNISGIATDQTDLPVTTAAYVAEKMHLPGIGCETARLFTDKFLMREKCRALGLKTPLYQRARSTAQALAFFDRLNQKAPATSAIIKPVDSQGSRGISIISGGTSRKDIKEKFNRALQWSDSKSVLLEQYIEGREFVVAGMACNGAFTNLAIGDSYYFSVPNVFTPASRVFPTTIDKQAEKKILELNHAIITGFDLKNGITHSEFIMDENNNIYLLETAARGGGMFISSDIIPALTGINTEAFIINAATSALANAPAISHTGLACCYIACVLPEGEVLSIKGLEEIDAMPYIRTHNLNAIHTGMQTKAFVDKTARYAVIITADNHDQLAGRTQKVKNTFHAAVKTKNGIKGAIWG